ncbi:hypothetical protein RHGRI_010396 [Rhododendron griersonianum]|uniref:Uncharacterized protein n=1 Tax=Rhododendron griersonianum TaxID=479676 RepID=A0AAV6KJ09_9ERIC|nr:hypothetical protein RHGRI_010396 [Rhododendron griersonianum]
MVRKEREPVDLRKAVRGRWGGQTTAPPMSLSTPTKVRPKEHPSKKPRIEHPEDRGEVGRRPGKRQVIDLEDQRENVRIEGPSKDDSAGDNELNAPWTPVFQTFSGRPITHADCAGLSLLVAYGILRARSLPRDIKATLTEANDLISEIAQYLALSCFSIAIPLPKAIDSLSW